MSDKAQRRSAAEQYELIMECRSNTTIQEQSELIASLKDKGIYG